MLAGVVVIQDANGFREIDARQFPDPDGSVTQEDDDAGSSDATPQSFRAQEASELLGGDDVSDVSGRVIITFRALVWLGGFAVSENGPTLTSRVRALPPRLPLRPLNSLRRMGAPVPSVLTQKISPAAGENTGPCAPRHRAMRGARWRIMRWIWRASMSKPA